MSVTVGRIIAGLVVLVAIVFAVTGQNPGNMGTMLMLAALGIAIIVPW